MDKFDTFLHVENYAMFFFLSKNVSVYHYKYGCKQNPPLPPKRKEESTVYLYGQKAQ